MSAESQLCALVSAGMAPLYGGVIIAREGAGTGQAATAAHGGLRTPGTDGHMWLASSVPGMHYRQVLRQTAGQQVTSRRWSARKRAAAGRRSP